MIKRLPWEALVWTAALMALAFLDTEAHNHFTFCPFYHLGIDFCPGCGLGRSIAYLFRGDLMQSLNVHPLGVFAVIILFFRIIQLTYHYRKTLWQK